MPTSFGVGRQASPHAARRPVLQALETSPFPILLVSLVGIVLLTSFGPSLVVGDTWLTLMAGREIADHGLPSSESITILGQGATWTDQQWLAQLAFYAAHELAGVRAVVLLDVALVLLALGLATATARTSGATSRSTFLIGVLAILAGPWGWTVRAQSTALPLFAGVLWLLVDASRHGLRRRTLLVLPLLMLWANLHGSVLLGAGLTVLLGVLTLVRARRVEPISLVLVVLAPLSVLASPYGTKLIAYYDLMLVDAPFAEMLDEWQWSRPSGTTALFWILVLVAAALLAARRCRSRLTSYEVVVLATTGAGAVQAIRGVIWFALASAAILPVALDGLLTRPDLSARRVNRVISTAALAGLALAFASALARPASWFTEVWPDRGAEAVRAATSNPDTKLFATDRTSDWLLWRIPDLRGRIAFDVRFELYDERALDEILRYGRGGPGWTSSLVGYDVAVVEGPPTGRRAAALLSDGATVAYADRKFTVLRLR